MTERPRSRPIRLPGRMQDRLALGYLYLLFVGIASDSLYYGVLGVNIIQHSTVLDVLLSPLVRLGSSLLFTAVIVLMPLAAYLAIRYAPEALRRRLDQKRTMTPGIVWLAVTGWIVFSAYLGFGLGAGNALRDGMHDGTLRMDHVVTFQDGQVAQARLVGINSSFAFLVLEGASVVEVVPVHENIRSIARRR